METNECQCHIYNNIVYVKQETITTTIVDNDGLSVTVLLSEKLARSIIASSDSVDKAILNILKVIFDSMHHHFWNVCRSISPQINGHTYNELRGLIEKSFGDECVNLWLCTFGKMVSINDSLGCWEIRFNIDRPHGQ